MYFTLWDVGIFCLVGLVSLTRAGSNKEDRQPSISIVGGTAALPGEFPALGAILLPSLTTPGKYQAICAGTLITPSHILTAAHCAVMLRTGRSFAYQVFYPKVIFTNDLYQSVKAVIRTLTRAIVHENWNTSNQLNDIAVILLDSPITTLPLTKLPVANSIALGVPKSTATTGRSTTRRSTTRRQTTGRQTTGRPTMKQPTKKQDFKPKARALATRAFSSYANARAVIAGWGTTIYGASDSNSNLLLKANVTIHDNSVCIKQYHGKVIFYPTEMLCASDPGRDTCEGDSGGPIYVNGTQVGITSWGVGCAASNYAGVYTRVTNYVDWIATTVAKNQPKNTAFAVNKQTRQN